MVVREDTAGTASRFRCIHLTVVRKHKQRLGQQRENCGPQATSSSAAATTHGEPRRRVHFAIANSEASRAQPASRPAPPLCRARGRVHAQQHAPAAAASQSRQSPAGNRPVCPALHSFSLQLQQQRPLQTLIGSSHRLSLFLGRNCKLDLLQF